MKKIMKKIMALVLCIMLSAFTLGCAMNSKDGKGAYVSVELWHYYTGNLKDMFDEYVKTFNNTVGYEKNMAIEAKSFQSIGALNDAVNAAAKKAPGSQEMPHMFATYTDSALVVDENVKLLDLNKYFSKSELDTYTPAYIKDGMFNDGRLVVFPTMKATENMIIDSAQFDEFTKDYPVYSYYDFECEEKIARMAEDYFTWSGGKGLYGRDALDNFILVSFNQLGEDLYTVDSSGKAVVQFNKEIMQQIWNSYYIPYIKGRFKGERNYVTDSVGRGEIISGTGSTSASSYYPNDTTIKVLKAPLIMSSAKRSYITQGAGIAVCSGNEAKEKAAVEFLKWFTEVERNIEYSLETGYLPVKMVANSFNVVKAHATENTDKNTLETIRVALETIASADQMYSAPLCKQSYSIRSLVRKSFGMACSENYNALEEAKKQGDSGVLYEEQLAHFSSQEYFNSWYNETKEKLNEIVS